MGNGVKQGLTVAKADDGFGAGVKQGLTVAGSEQSSLIAKVGGAFGAADDGFGASTRASVGGRQAKLAGRLTFARARGERSSLHANAGLDATGVAGPGRNHGDRGSPRLRFASFAGAVGLAVPVKDDSRQLPLPQGQR